MYNQIFSPQWIFDRCLEGSSFGLLVFIIITLILYFLFFLLWKKVRKYTSILANVLTSVLGILSLILGPFLAFIIMIFGGYFVLGCSAGGQFFPAIIEAHKIHALLKEQIHATGYPPKTLEEVKVLDQNSYEWMVRQGKVAYFYDAERNKYSLLVRPSRYYVAVFNSEVDFQLYKLNRSVGFSTGHALYPGETSLTMDQLPR